MKRNNDVAETLSLIVTICFVIAIVIWHLIDWTVWLMRRLTNGGTNGPK